MQKFIKQFLFIVGIFLNCDLNAQFVVDSLSAAYTSLDTAKVIINTDCACKHKSKSRLDIYFSIGALGDSIPTSFPVLTQTIAPAPTSFATGDLLVYLQNKPVWMTGKGRRTITSVNSLTTFSKDSLHKAYFKVKCVLSGACGYTIIRSKKGIIPPGGPAVLPCTPCVFIPTVYSCVGGNGNGFYLTNYNPLPTTFSGLPAVYNSAACGGSLNFKIRGVTNPVFPSTSMTWAGPGTGSTLIGSQATSTCDGGLPAGQANTYTVLTSSVTVPTLVTASFNSGECGIQNISFYILPDPPVVTTTAVPVVGLPCPLTFPLVYSSIQYNNLASFVAVVQAMYPTFTITYNALTCEFSFTGVATPPANVAVSAVPTGTVPVDGVFCPVSFPVNYLGNTYNTEALLLAAVQADYPAFTITYDNVTCLFTFTGVPTRPTNIPLTPYTPPALCLAPINAQFTEIASNGFLFSWQDGGIPPNDYKVEIYQGATLINTIYPAASGSVSYGGLSPNTSYEVRIIARCGAGDTDNKAPVSIFATTPLYSVLRNAGYGVRQFYSTEGLFLGNYVDMQYVDPVDHTLPAAAQNDYSPYGGPEVITRMSDLLDITSTASVFPFSTGGTAFQYNLDEYLRMDYFENGNARQFYVYNTTLLAPADTLALLTGVVGASTVRQYVEIVAYRANPFLGPQPNDNSLYILVNSFSGDISGTHVMEVLDKNNTVVATLTPSVSSPSGSTQTDFTLPANTAAYSALYAAPNGKYQLLNLRLRNTVVPANYDFSLRVIKTRVF